MFCFTLATLALASPNLFLPKDVPTVADPNGTATRVEGIVTREVEQRLSSQRVVLDHVYLADQPVEGKLLVWFSVSPRIEYGQRLVFTCRPQAPEPIDDFAYDRYLATQGILATCAFPQFADIHEAEPSIIGFILTLKTNLISTLKHALPEPHASFMSGLLFGGSSSLSSELKDDFSRTGTSHILAASGFNISLFSAVLLSWLLRSRLGRKRSLILATGLIAAYVIIAGLSPAVIRAGIMGLLVMLKFAINRKPWTTNILLLTAAVMLAINPLIIWDVGFQLSFVATIAIIELAPHLKRRLQWIPTTLELREATAGSLAAILLTLPIMLWHFGSVSLMAPIANLLVLPLVPINMVTGLLVIATSAITSISSLIALPAWALTNAMLWIISSLSQIPFALAEPTQARFLAAAATIAVIYIMHKRASL